MSFPRAPIKRFNDSPGFSAPPPGSYDPKFLTDVGASSQRFQCFDRSCRLPAFRKQDSSGVLNPPLPEAEKHNSYASRSNSPSPMSHRRSSSSSLNRCSTAIPYENSTKRETTGTGPIRCNSYTSVITRQRPLMANAAHYNNIPTFATRIPESMERINAKIARLEQEKKDLIKREKLLLEKVDDLQKSAESEAKAVKEQQEQMENDRNNNSRAMQDLVASNQQLQANLVQLEETKINLENDKLELEYCLEKMTTKIRPLEEFKEQLEGQVSNLEETISTMKVSMFEVDGKLVNAEEENSNLTAQIMTTVEKLVKITAEKEVWLENENSYKEVISNLKETLSKNHELLRTSDERVKVLVLQLQNHYEIGKEKVSEMEKIRTTWGILETEYNQTIDEYRKKLSEKEEELEKAKCILTDDGCQTEQFWEESFLDKGVDLQSVWNVKELEYTDTIDALNAKCVDLQRAAMLYKTKLLSVLETWKNILPIKQQLLEFREELSRLVAKKEHSSHTQNVNNSGGSQNFSETKDSTQIPKIHLVPIAQFVSDVERENVSLRESISYMQGAIADILSSDIINTANGSNHGDDGNTALFSQSSASSVKFGNSNKTDIEEMLAGSSAIKKALSEKVMKKLSDLGLVDETMNNTFDRLTAPSPNND